MKVNTYILKTMIRFFNFCLIIFPESSPKLWNLFEFLEGKFFNFKLGKHHLAPQQKNTTLSRYLRYLLSIPPSLKRSPNAMLPALVIRVVNVASLATAWA